MVFEIGRICIKTRGREAGRVAVVVDIIDENFVIVDGDLKRRRVNIDHLEPTPDKIDIKPGAPTEEVIKKLIEKGIKISYWKIKKDNLLHLSDLLKEKFGENWEEELKKIKAPGK